MGLFCQVRVCEAPAFMYLQWVLVEFEGILTTGERVYCMVLMVISMVKFKEYNEFVITKSLTSTPFFCIVTSDTKWVAYSYIIICIPYHAIL